MNAADGFETFVVIVESGSISAAARALGMPRATVSRHLAQLESQLEVRLIHRSTRKLVLSKAGEALYKRARSIVEQAREARAAVRRIDDIPRGRVRVSLPPSNGDVAGLFVSFLDRWPEVELEVSTASRHVDLKAEGIDVALRVGPISDTSLVARKLFAARIRAVATPQYLDRRGRPTSLDQLAGQECIRRFDGQGQLSSHWPLMAGGTVEVSGRLCLSDMNDVVHCALAGFGIAMIPLSMGWKSLEAGRLEVVLCDQLGTESVANLVYAERRWLEPAVRAFVDHTLEFFENHPFSRDYS